MQDRAATASAADKESIAQETVRAAVVTTEVRAAIVTQDRVATGRETTAQETVRAAVVTTEVRAVTATADRRAQETGKVREDKAEVRVKAAAVTIVRHFPRWRPSRRRRMSKSACTRIRKETNSRSWITAAADRARRTKRECSSALLKSRRSRRSTTDRSRWLRKKRIFWRIFQPEPLQSLHRSQSQASASRSAFQPHRSSWRL